MQNDRLPGGEKFNFGEVTAVVAIFLASIIVPIALDNSYLAVHRGTVAMPWYVPQIMIWGNLAAFLFALSLMRRRSKATQAAAVILVILSLLYFGLIFMMWIVGGFIG